MKTLFGLSLACAMMIGSVPVLAQDNNANPAAPGQDRTCLVTTGVPNSWNDVDIVGTKWLPRKAAEAQAKKNPTTMRTFEYADDPLVLNHTYASAEELCNEHFVK